MASASIKPSPELFEKAFTHAAIGMALVGLDGSWLKVNDALCRILGYSRAELLAQNFQVVTHPEDLGKDLDLVEQLLAGAIESYDLEKRYLHKRGQTVWVSLTATLVRSADGEPEFFISQIQDVTRRRYAETETSTFFEITADLLAIAGNTGMLDRVSSAWERSLGWTSEQLTQTQFLDFVHPDDRDKTVAEAERVYSGYPTPGFRNRYRAVDGAYHWLEWNTRIGPDGRLYCNARDVSEQRKAEQAVAESEARFRALAEGSLQGIVVERIDKDYQPLYVNDAAAKMFGYESGAELLAFSSLRHLAPEASLEMGREGWNALLSGQVPHVEGRVEMRRRDGSVIAVDLLGTVIPWDGEPAFQMTMFDSTERVRLQSELEELAKTDPLTGVYNRRELAIIADRELRRIERYPQPFSVLLVDADHFKRVNDEHGHATGDRVLCTIAQLLRNVVRDTDVVARWGGEEFLVLLIGTQCDGAREAAERVRIACMDARTREDGRSVAVTLSIGVTERRAGELQFEPIVERADRALYAAKNAGRNATRVER